MGRWIKDTEGVLTYNPYRLAFYEKEQALYGEVYRKELDYTNLKRAFEKLKRHFKLSLSIVHHRRSGGSFRGRNGYGTINLPHNTNWGVFIHEIAHALDSKKRKTKHDKKLMTVIKRVNAYCVKNNFWEVEFKKRDDLQEQRYVKENTKPTPEQEKEAKIEKRKADILRYERKVRFYSNKLKKAKRSLSMLERGGFRLRKVVKTASDEQIS